MQQFLDDQMQPKGLLVALLSDTTDAIIAFDPSARVTLENSVAKKIFAPISDESETEIFDFLAEDIAQSFRFELSDYATGASRKILTNEPREIRMRGAEGTIVIKATIREYLEQGRAMLVLVGRAVGHRKAAEERRRDLERQLLQANKLEAVGQLAGGIAHEINTPVQFVGDNLNFLSDSFFNLKVVLEKYKLAAEASSSDRFALIRDAREHAEQADLSFLLAESPSALAESLQGITQISRIVRALREFAHPVSFEKEAVDLNKIIETTLTVSRNEWKNAAEVITNLSPHLPPALGFPGEISQVLLNLIINATHAIREKYGNQRGRIEIETGIKSRRIIVTISDNGCGIPDAIREKIFEPFFTTKEVGAGTGQGLAISRDIIVLRHSGEISFRSNPDLGTTFEISLPLVSTGN